MAFKESFYEILEHPGVALFTMLVQVTTVFISFLEKLLIITINRGHPPSPLRPQSNRVFCPTRLIQVSGGIENLAWLVRLG